MNYVRGIPVWATLLALERDGAVEVGRRLGAGARPPLVGGPRRGRLRRRQASGERVPRLGGRRGSRTASPRRRRRARCRRAGPSSSRRAWAIRGLERLLAALPRRRGRARRRRRPGAQLWDYAAVRLDRRGGRRPLHDVRRRGARAGRDVAEHERRAARAGRGDSGGVRRLPRSAFEATSYAAPASSMRGRMGPGLRADGRRVIA